MDHESDNADFDKAPPVKVDEYDPSIRLFCGAYDEMFRLAHSCLRSILPRQGRVLVAGAGTGAEILEMAPGNPGWSFVGIDPSGDMLSLAREKIAREMLPNEINLIQSRVEAISRNLRGRPRPRRKSLRRGHHEKTSLRARRPDPGTPGGGGFFTSLPFLHRIPLPRLGRHKKGNLVKDFPEFMMSAANEIPAAAQSTGAQTAGARGWVFHGADDMQMAFWICERGGKSEEHVHDFDEYFTVVQGRYTVFLEGHRIDVRKGEECHIPEGVPHSGEFEAGTRTIHCFGGKRV